jgi:hypothetical protein
MFYTVSEVGELELAVLIPSEVANNHGSPNGTTRLLSKDSLHLGQSGGKTATLAHDMSLEFYRQLLFFPTGRLAAGEKVELQFGGSKNPVEIGTVPENPDLVPSSEASPIQQKVAVDGLGQKDISFDSDGVLRIVLSGNNAKAERLDVENGKLTIALTIPENGISTILGAMFWFIIGAAVVAVVAVVARHRKDPTKSPLGARASEFPIEGALGGQAARRLEVTPVSQELDSLIRAAKSGKALLGEFSSSLSDLGKQLKTAGSEAHHALLQVAQLGPRLTTKATLRSTIEEHWRSGRPTTALAEDARTNRLDLLVWDAMAEILSDAVDLSFPPWRDTSRGPAFLAWVDHAKEPALLLAPANPQAFGTTQALACLQKLFDLQPQPHPGDLTFLRLLEPCALTSAAGYYRVSRKGSIATGSREGVPADYVESGAEQLSLTHGRLRLLLAEVIRDELSAAVERRQLPSFPATSDPHERSASRTPAAQPCDAPSSVAPGATEPAQEDPGPAHSTWNQRPAPPQRLPADQVPGTLPPAKALAHPGSQRTTWSLEWLDELLRGVVATPTPDSLDYLCSLQGLADRVRANPAFPMRCSLNYVRVTISPPSEVSLVEASLDPVSHEPKLPGGIALPPDAVWQVLLAVRDERSNLAALVFSWSRLAKGAPLLAQALARLSPSESRAEFVQCLRPAIIEIQPGGGGRHSGVVKHSMDVRPLEARAAD